MPFERNVKLMMYNSTTDKNLRVSAAQAIAQGISTDGGLFVPCEIPSYGEKDLKDLLALDYCGRAKKILKDYLTDFTEEEICECVDRAYTKEKFGSGNPAPLVYMEQGDAKINMLELWHGPTCAFKDMALQILPHLLTKSLQKTCKGKEAVILVATSGDTGKAALEGFKDVNGTKIIVFYPQNGVSPMQKHQMNTQLGENVNVCAIEGNFDDAQTGVKKIFTTEEIIDRLSGNGLLFSSANSINWGRLLPQIVYYFSAYCDLVASGRAKLGEKINIVVPTGNFGNILASYYAMCMGLPVHKFICASNSNNVLTDFIKTGVYNKERKFYTTVSPSMDILVSSNLERLLYHLSGGCDNKIKGWMASLKTEGRYEVDAPVMMKIANLFFGGCCDDEETKKTIKQLYSDAGYLCDTHTAVAVNVYDQYIAKTGDKETPAIVVSTASPYKFSKSVLEAVSDGKTLPESEFDMVDELCRLTGKEVPVPLSDLRGREVRFDNLCAPQEMPQYVLRTLGI